MPDCNNRTCKHKKWPRDSESTHCAEMSCENYIAKCDRHGYAGRAMDFQMDEDSNCEDYKS
jgi:hypothetical protein